MITKKFFSVALFVVLSACGGANVDTALLKDPKIGDHYVIDYEKLKIERKMRIREGSEAGYLPARVAEVTPTAVTLKTGKEEFGELGAAVAEMGSGNLDGPNYFSPYVLEIPKGDLAGYADKKIILNTVRP